MSSGQGKAAEATLTLQRDELRRIDRTSDLERKVSEIFSLLRLPIYRYLLGVLGHRDDAEEITQEVFLSLYSHLKKGNSVDNYRAWAFRVAHNMAINHQKRSTLIEPLGENEWERLCESSKDPSHDSELLLLNKERYRRVSKALALLSPQERHCLNLRAEGLCFREISEALGIRISTVETFIDRGIKRIAKEING